MFGLCPVLFAVMDKAAMDYLSHDTAVYENEWVL